MPDGRQVSSASLKTGVSPVLKIEFYNVLEYNWKTLQYSLFQKHRYLVRILQNRCLAYFEK